jgi:hypothetical protein
MITARFILRAEELTLSSIHLLRGRRCTHKENV